MPLNSLRKVNGENEIRSAMTQRLAYRDGVLGQASRDGGYSVNWFG